MPAKFSRASDRHGELNPAVLGVGEQAVEHAAVKVDSGDQIAALNVYWEELLPADHSLRRFPQHCTNSAPRLLHARRIRAFFRESIENMLAYLDGKPTRLQHCSRPPTTCPSCIWMNEPTTRSMIPESPLL